MLKNVFSAALLVSLTGCGPEEIAPKNHSSHAGWGRSSCYASDCHSADRLTIFHDPTVPFYECTQCHGGNGACEQRDTAGHTHAPGDDCIECHQDKHGYNEASQCEACHLNPFGTRDCS